MWLNLSLGKNDFNTRKGLILLKPLEFDKIKCVDRFIHSLNEDYLKLNFDVSQIIFKYIEIEFD